MKILTDIITSPVTFLAVGIIMAVLAQIKSCSYINVTDIIKEYFNEFIINNKSSILMLIFVPATIAESINLISVIHDESLDIITLCVSILITFFFSYFTFFNDYNSSSSDTVRKKQNIDIVKKESKAIASYQILLCIIILLLSFIYPLFEKYNFVFYIITDTTVLSVRTIVSFLINYLFLRIIINFFVLMKRHMTLNK